MCHVTTTKLKVTCPVCRGFGAIDDGQDSFHNLKAKCPYCNGHGHVYRYYDRVEGEMLEIDQE